VLSSSEQRKRREERTDNRPAVVIVWKNGSIKVTWAEGVYYMHISIMGEGMN